MSAEESTWNEKDAYVMAISQKIDIPFHVSTIGINV
jgi:hypothetical protein